MTPSDKVLRVAALVGHKVGEGEDLDASVRTVANALGLAPAAVYAAVHVAADYVSDIDIRHLAR